MEAFRRLAFGAAVLVATAGIGTGSASASPQAAPPVAGQPDFGPNVTVFDPSMPTSEIQATVDAIAA
jgi:hypothetical protein